MARQPDELFPTRATLIYRLKDWQNQSSWQEFFDTYWKLIYGVAHKAGLSDAEAQDVVQETMVSVSKHIPTFNYDPALGSFKAWLLNMTRWRITDQFRKRLPAAEPCPATDRSTNMDPLNNVADPADETLDAAWAAEWENKLLEAAINKVKRRVDPLKYQVFDLYVNKEWPPEKIAASFGITVDQVYVIKHRITGTIKTEVKRLQKGIT